MAISLECEVNPPSIIIVHCLFAHIFFPGIQVPILVNRWMREAYSFLDDDRVVVTRPQAAREISAVKALRTGHWSPPTLARFRYHMKEMKTDMEDMITKGWIRTADQFAAFKHDIWASNEEVVRHILHDLD
jgi:hypothetical protein